VLLAYLFVPLLSAALMPLLRKLWIKATTTLALLAVLYQLLISIWIAYRKLVVGQPLHLGQWLFGGKLALSIDGLTLMVLLTIGLVALVALGFAANYQLSQNRRPGFNALVLLAVTGMNGLVMATDLFSLYVFLEIVAVTSFVLITYQQDDAGIEGAFKYMMLSAVATVFLLLGMAIVFALTGSIGYADISAALNNSNLFLKLSLGFFIFAFALKAGLMPFHAWLPDAYTAAPAPVSILLGGIVTKVAGVYSLMRLMLSVFGFSKSLASILLIFGSISIVFGAFMALGQRDFKRMLAFSSISQIGYIVIGFAVGNTLGLVGAAFHFFNHGVFKALLFANAGAVEEATGTRNFDELGGLAEKMPVTGITSVIGFLSAAGIPPLAGFWSKLLIIMGVWTAGYRVCAGIAVFAGLVTLAYLLLMQREVFFGKLRAGLEEIKEVSWRTYWPAILLAVVTIVSGIFFAVVLNKLIIPVKLLLGE